MRLINSDLFNSFGCVDHNILFGDATTELKIRLSGTKNEFRFLIYMKDLKKLILMEID